MDPGTDQTDESQSQVRALSVIQSDKIYCVSGDSVRRTNDSRS